MMKYPGANKEIGHVRPTPAPRPLTKEEQAQRLSAIFAQKKEQLFQGCLFSLLSNPAIVKDSLAMQDVVDKANGLAEIALYKLYPNLKEED